ncbi:MAG: hypothetical protein ACK559_09325, partial [bacterium]
MPRHAWSRAPTPATGRRSSTRCAGPSRRTTARRADERAQAARLPFGRHFIDSRRPDAAQSRRYRLIRLW